MTERRALLTWCTIVAGITALVVARFFDVESFNAVVESQSALCAKQEEDADILNARAEALMDIGGSLNEFLVITANGRDLAPAVQRALKKIDLTKVPDCANTVPEEKSLSPIRIGE